MAHPLVVHTKRDEFDVYVGRPTEWGNPFVIGTDGDRDEVVEKFRAYLWGNIQDAGLAYIERLAELDGKRLACWCAPRACHAEVLVAAARWAKHALDSDAGFVVELRAQTRETRAGKEVDG